MKRKLNEEWTGYVVGKMHQWGITQAELAAKCGYTTQYVSMILNGKKRFEKVESREKTKQHVIWALEEIIKEVSYGYDPE